MKVLDGALAGHIGRGRDQRLEGGGHEGVHIGPQLRAELIEQAVVEGLVRDKGPDLPIQAIGRAAVLQLLGELAKVVEIIFGARVENVGQGVVGVAPERILVVAIGGDRCQLGAPEPWRRPAGRGGNPFVDDVLDPGAIGVGGGVLRADR